jgi:hypothetical protein
MKTMNAGNFEGKYSFEKKVFVMDDEKYFTFGNTMITGIPEF